MSTASATLKTITTSLQSDLTLLSDLADKTYEHSTSARSLIAADIRAAASRLKEDLRRLTSDLQIAMATDRDSYVTALQDQLNNIRQEIDELRVRSALAGDEDSQERERLIHGADNAWLAAHSRLTKAQGDTHTALIDLRADLDQVRHDLAHAVSDAASAFRRSTRKDAEV
jgi:predicted  nucleic acid-binding Zn-ribbon protein